MTILQEFPAAKASPDSSPLPFCKMQSPCSTRDSCQAGLVQHPRIGRHLSVAKCQARWGESSPSAYTASFQLHTCAIGTNLYSDEDTEAQRGFRDKIKVAELGSGAWGLTPCLSASKPSKRFASPLLRCQTRDLSVLSMQAGTWAGTCQMVKVHSLWLQWEVGGPSGCIPGLRQFCHFRAVWS